MKRRWASDFFGRKINRSFTKDFHTTNTNIKKLDRLTILNIFLKVLYSVGILVATGFLAWSTYLLNESSNYANEVAVGNENNVFWGGARKALNDHEEDSGKMFEDAKQIYGILNRITLAINSQRSSFKKTHGGITRSDYIAKQVEDLNFLYANSVTRISILTNFYSSFVFGESREAILLRIPKWDEASVVLTEEDKKDRDIFEMEKKIISSVDRNAPPPEYAACVGSLATLDKKYLVAIKKYEKDDYFVSWIDSIERSLGKVSGVKKSAVINSENLHNTLADASAYEKNSWCSAADTLQETIRCESKSIKK